MSTEIDIATRWEEVVADLFLKFDQIKNKRSNRPDLHAFLLLDELFPGDINIVESASHDVIYLSIDGDQVHKLTDDQIIELSRCGVMYDEILDCLTMFAQ